MSTHQPNAEDTGAVDAGKPSVNFVNVPIPQFLKPYIDSMVGFYELDAPAVVRAETPSLNVPLILVLGRGYTHHESVDSQASRSLNRSFVAGPHQTMAYVGSDGWSVCIQVNLTVAGAFRLLRCHMADLSGQIADLGDVLGAVAHDLEGQLIEMNDWSVRFHAVLEFLTQRMADGPSCNPQVEQALEMIQGSNGGIRIQTVVRKIGCSRKHLAQLFAREVGLSPKRVARLVRFEHLSTILNVPGISLADAALRAGYADQAHMNHELMTLTEQTPAEFMTR